MRKIVSIFLVVLLVSFLKPQAAQAQIPPKARAFMTITAYGTAGGALLGAASMAFGTSTRAIAQGASLGLYAGILFGTYVLVSHHQRRQGSYDDRSSPYGDSTDIYGDGYNSEEGGGEAGAEDGFFNRFEALHHKFQTNKKGGSLPPLQINIFQYNF